jgi:hypothetical protein
VRKACELHTTTVWQCGRDGKGREGTAGSEEGRPRGDSTHTGKLQRMSTARRE